MAQDSQTGERREPFMDDVYRVAFEHSLVGLALTTPDQHLVRANAALVGMLGYSEDELRECGIESLTHPDDRHFDLSVHDELLAGHRGSYELEKRLVHRDGSTVWAEFKVGAVTDDLGRITLLVSQVVNMSDHVVMLQASTWAADHDPLTGALNRAGLTRELERSLRRGTAGRHTAVMYLDLDQFKKVNDAFGHASGDRYLVMLVDRLNQVIRETDAVARVGGDEFVLLIRDIPGADQALVVAETVRAAVERLGTEGSEFGSVTASIGVVVTSAESSSVVLTNADRAMFTAKRSGGNRVSLVESEIFEELA